MMKRTQLYLVVMLLLSGCDIYIVQSAPSTSPPSSSPDLFQVPTSTQTPAVPTASAIPTFTEFPLPLPATTTPASEVMPGPGGALPELEILGCDTGVDLAHGMYEVTNAYVSIRNASQAALDGACVVLRAIDEDREHPDKKRCLASLPAGFGVTTKLTVDSTYRTDTAIQVDLSMENSVLFRVAEDACPDIGLFGGPPAALDVIVPLASSP